MILFARLGDRMGKERLPKRVMVGEQKGGKWLLGRQEEDWVGCLERDLSSFNPFRTAVPFWGRAGQILGSLSGKQDCSPERVSLPIEEEQRTLAAKKSGEWFRRLEEAAEQYTHEALAH